MNKFKFLSILLLSSNLIIAKPVQLTPEEINLIQQNSDKQWVKIPKSIQKILNQTYPELTLTIGEQDLVLSYVTDLINSQELTEKTLNQLTRYKTKIEAGKVSIKPDELTTRDTNSDSTEEQNVATNVSGATQDSANEVHITAEPDTTATDVVVVEEAKQDITETTTANETIVTETTEETNTTSAVENTQTTEETTSVTTETTTETTVIVTEEQTAETPAQAETSENTTSVATDNSSITVAATNEVTEATVITNETAELSTTNTTEENSSQTIATDTVTTTETTSTEVIVEKDVKEETEEKPSILESILNWIESKI